MWVVKYENNQFYFGNTKTRKSQWHIPESTILTACTKPGWKMLMTDGDIVYMNQSMSLTRKTMPIPESMGIWSMHYGDGWCWFYEEKSDTCQWEIPMLKSADQAASIWEMRYAMGHIYFYHENIVKCDVPCFGTVPCEIIRGLNWTGASCYLDSVLVALFATPTEFTEKMLYDPEYHTTQGVIVQKQLRKIVESMRGQKLVKTCSNLRLAFKQVYHPEKYWDSNTKDAGEFLVYLLSIFPDTNTASLTETGYFTNNLTDLNPSDKVQANTIIDTRASIVWTVDSLYLAQQPPTAKISDFTTMQFTSTFDKENLYIDEKTGKKYRKKTTVRSLVDAPYIVFNIMRKNVITNGLIKIRIIPDETIELPENRFFTLSSIVVYVPGHYVCYFSCGNTWYFYDDSGGMHNIKKIGGYTSLLKSNPSVTTSGVLYFYTPSKNYSNDL